METGNGGERVCACCGRELVSDEVGASRKFLDVNRLGCFCLSCLAEEIGSTEEKLKERIAYYKQMGCSYFD